MGGRGGGLLVNAALGAIMLAACGMAIMMATALVQYYAAAGSLDDDMVLPAVGLFAGAMVSVITPILYGR